jgi:hypothetical protein
MLNLGDRNRVVWVGREIPEELRVVSNLLGLALGEPVRNVRRIDVASPDLFTILISADGHDFGKVQGRLPQLFTDTHIFDFGVMLGVVSNDEANAITQRSYFANSRDPNVVAIASNVVSIPLRQEEIARYLRLYKPGPPANSDLTIHGQGKTNSKYADDTDAILLRRAFNDFGRIELEKQPGGFSAACNVWKIKAYSIGGDTCEPFVAKAALRADLKPEFDTYCAFVRDSVPFPFRAPILEDRFVKGATRAVLVSAFVGRSQRLDEYLATASSPELVMVSLFEGALGNWRRTATPNEASIGRFYVDQQRVAAGSNTADALSKSLLPNPESLTLSFRLARIQKQSLPSPTELWKELEQLPLAEHRICRVHGDLNMRNVFVRWNAIDTILIDFSRSDRQESLARDPSKLETNIAMMALDTKGKWLRRNVVVKLYKHPLLPPRDFMIFDGRTDAIRQIRRQAGGEGISNDEYELLTACHLLRFASEPAKKIRQQPGMNMEQRRALAYRIACELVANVTKSSKDAKSGL